MISRKIEKRLEVFFEAKGEYALLIDGVRQVGKTFIIEEFGRKHYENVIKIDFVKMRGAVELFQNVEDESEIITHITTFSRKPLIERKTLIFLDEIQWCPEAVTYNGRNSAQDRERRAGNQLRGRVRECCCTGAEGTWFRTELLQFQGARRS